MKSKITGIVLAALLLSQIPVCAAKPDEIRIGIIDSGISSTAIAKESILTGHNYVFPEESTEDKLGHGTAIAAIIVGSKPAGIKGICPDAKLVPLILATEDTSGYPAQLDAEEIGALVRDAVDRFECDIINISATTRVESESLKEAIAYAEEKGVLVVASSGNSGSYAAFYPANYESVLNVGALDKTETTYADFSNRNATLDLLAPGVDLTLANIDGTTRIEYGTSYSAAYVTGAAAKLMQTNPSLTAEQIRQVLCSSARDVWESGFDIRTGWGALDLTKALEYARQGRLFRDTPANEWFFEGVSFITSRGLMKGTGQTTFSPQQTTTRAMMWVILYRMDGQTGTATGADWYKEAQKWVKANKIADGKSPDAVITREEIAQILYNYAIYKGQDVSKNSNYDLSTFKDAAKVSKSAQKAMKWACATGIINGIGDTLQPTGSATRAQISTMLMRYCK